MGNGYAEALERRFWAKVSKGTPKECWPWQGYVKPSGHGMTSHKSDCIHAHRKAWILTRGPIRGELCVNHRCDNKLCCNPAHLYLGTRADNMIDMWNKTAPSERGRRPYSTKLTPAELGRLIQMREGGALLQTCADEFGVHIATVCRYVTQQRSARAQKLKADRLARVSR